MAKSDDLLARMEALNRKPLQHRPAAGELEEVRRKLRKQQPARRPSAASAPQKGSSSAPAGPPPDAIEHRQLPRTVARIDQSLSREPVALADALPGAVAPSPCGRQAWLLERRAEDLVTDAGAVRLRFQRRMSRGSHLHRRLGDLARREEVAPQDLLFVDIETTGLSNAPLFLIGTLEIQPESLLVRQYFARDYSEESAVTSLFVGHAAHKHVLVSFNGTTFDLRYIRERATVHGLRCHLGHPHLDLLPESRRAWRRGLPNCKLQTLEYHICHRTRTDDIPGHLIPEAYHAYVRTGDASEMIQVIEHNLLDLVTMVDLLARLPR